MAQQTASIVTNGLVFAYDMNNTKKSWKGEPVTNQFSTPTPYDANGNVNFPVQGTTGFRRIYSGNYGGYEIQPSDVVYRYDLGGTGCHYHGNSAAISAGQYVVYSCDYYISPDVSGFPNNSTLIVLENYGGGAVGGGTGVGGIGIRGTWQTIQGYSGPTSASGTQAMFLYPGSCGSYMATRGFILMKNPMFEFRSTVKYNPYVNGTRSTSQAVLDLTGRRTITIGGSPTYNNDGTFTFNSAGSTTLNLGSGSNFLPMPSLSLEAWVKTPGLGSGMTVNGIWGFTYGIRVDSYSDGSIGFIIGTDTTTYVNVGTSGVNINDNLWHHIVAVKNGDSSYAIYVDGVVRASGVPVAGWSGTNPWYAMEIQVGRDQNNSPYFFNGRIDVGRVYNRGLTAAEVQKNFNALRGRYGL